MNLKYFVNTSASAYQMKPPIQWGKFQIKFFSSKHNVDFLNLCPI